MAESVRPTVADRDREAKEGGDVNVAYAGNILRVFPYRTSYTPHDPLAFVGFPPDKGFIPEHSEVHVSCTFTWDKELCEEIAYQWDGKTNKPVMLGGPAHESPVDGFVPGLYVAKNIIFTTRGCNNNCPWCCVPKREGKLTEQTIYSGNIIQDNNFLQASRQHKDKVFEMLKTQNMAVFKGGLETDLIDDHFISSCQRLKTLPELWLACDTDAALSRLKRACNKLHKAGWKQDKIRCYALIGDDMEKNESRLREIFYAGALPSAQLFREFANVKTPYSHEWNNFERTWQRPAAMKAHMRDVICGHEAASHAAQQSLFVPPCAGEKEEQ